jgi:3-oxoacyl-(acyl-carrier-protein) synthase
LQSASGESITDAIELALSRAGLVAADIDAVVPMGLSIPGIDAGEADAMATVFGDAQPHRILVTPITGNCCAGHGATQLCVAAHCIDIGALPGGGNAPNHMLVMTASQGGQNTATILSRPVA